MSRSRVAKNPVHLPDSVKFAANGKVLAFTSSKGSLEHQLPDSVQIRQEGNLLHVETLNDSQQANCLSGTTRALINNIVLGLSKGFERKLELFGTGYRAQVQGKVLNLVLGYSHPINFEIPNGISIETPSQTEILIKGIDKQLIGQVAANIRAYRKPDAYKGKGVRFAGEKIQLKETTKKK